MNFDDPSEFGADLARTACAHGVKQWAGDSASAIKDGTEAVKAVDAKIAEFHDGTWSDVGGRRLDPVVNAARAMLYSMGLEVKDQKRIVDYESARKVANEFGKEADLKAMLPILYVDIEA